MQVKSVYISVNAQHLMKLSQNSSNTSVSSPSAHHQPSADLRPRRSGVQWELCISQLIFCIFFSFHTLTHTHIKTHILLHGLCQHIYRCHCTFFFFCLFAFCLFASSLLSGQQPSEKPISKCCLHRPTFVAIVMSGNVNFLFLGEIQSLNVKARMQALTGVG